MTISVSIRPLTGDDETFIWSLASDPRVVKWVGDGMPWSREYFTERFALAMLGGAPSLPGSARWFVAQRNHDKPVGLLTLTRTPAGAEIGYWVAPDSWGHGIAKQLVDAAIDYSAGLDLTARVHPDNAASRHVLETKHFQQVTQGEFITYSRLA